ncbi:hypothetical protein [Ensifer sp. ENS02]|uniref:hypothetical protein n=1 Tax=Ensifer sp. ENS02 TaxID=2769290 RepID=UPI001FEE1764|nr:hypothetical protein [Ensifer sp. ENS02]
MIGTLAVDGCQSTEDAQPYSANYRMVPLGGQGFQRKSAFVTKDHDNMVQTVLVPEACISPDTAAQPLYLPSGCANNLNLELMVQRQQDLARGRPMGPAMAEPVARAARDYIDEKAPERLGEATNVNIDSVGQ